MHVKCVCVCSRRAQDDAAFFHQYFIILVEIRRFFLSISKFFSFHFNDQISDAIADALAQRTLADIWNTIFFVENAQAPSACYFILKEFM